MTLLHAILIGQFLQLLVYQSHRNLHLSQAIAFLIAINTSLVDDVSITSGNNVSITSGNDVSITSGNDVPLSRVHYCVVFPHIFVFFLTFNLEITLDYWYFFLDQSLNMSNYECPKECRL